MSGRLRLSLDMTKIQAAYKAGHSAFNVGKKNGHVYLNLTAWLNDEENEFHQNSSAQLNSAKDQDAADTGKLGDPKGKYVGNGVWSMDGPNAAGGSGIDGFGGTTASPPATKAIDDLPF